MVKSRILASASVMVFAVAGWTSAHAAEAPFAAPPAQAEDTASGGLGDIIVTARRVEENLQSVPVAVTALPAEKLEQRNIKAVNDLQFSVPNLQIRPNNTYPSQAEFVMRGQRQVLLTDENVVTYINDVPQSTRGLTLYDLQSVQAFKGPQGTLFGRNAMGGAMVFTTKRPEFDIGGLAEVEVGNYSRKQFTGVINVPLMADTIALRAAGRVERQDGFFKNLAPGQKDLNNRHNNSGRVSLLLKPTDRFENLTMVDYIKRHEIPIPSPIEAAPLANNFFRSITQQAVAQQSALGGATPFTDTANGLLVRRGNPFRSIANTHFSDVIKTSPNPPNLAGVPVAFGALSHFDAKSTVWGFSNISTFELNDQISFKNIIGYRHEVAWDHQDPSGLSGMNFDLGPLLTSFGAPTPSGVVFGQSTNNDTYYRNAFKGWSEEFQVVGNMDNFNFIAGGFYSDSKRLYAVNSTFVVGPISLYGPFPVRHSQMNAKSKSLAGFVQGTYDFAGLGLEGLKLTGGVRYTREKKSHFNENFFSTSNDQLQEWNSSRPQSTCNMLNGTLGNATAVNNGAECFIAAKRTYKAWTYTASLDYELAPDTIIYAATRRGFKAGNPNPTTRSLIYTMFGGENITDYEVGLKAQGELGGMAYRFNIAGFIGKYKKIQTQDILQFCANPAAVPGSPACGTYTDLIVLNLGRATIKGIEVEATLKPIPQLQFDLGYSYQVGRYGKGSIVAQPTNPALPIADSNPINFAGGVDLQGSEFAGMPRTNLTLGATFYADFIPESFAKTTLTANYYYRSKTKGIPVQGIYQTPSFHTLGARLSFDHLFESPVSLALWGSNITNERYKLACSNNLNSIGYSSCKWGDPRTYGGTLKVEF